MWRRQKAPGKKEEGKRCGEKRHYLLGVRGIEWNFWEMNLESAMMTAFVRRKVVLPVFCRMSTTALLLSFGPKLQGNSPQKKALDVLYKQGEHQ